MSIPAAVSDLPGVLLAPGLDGVYGFRDQSRALLMRVRSAENVAYCHTITAVYGLYRTMYGEAEDAYLALAPGDFTMAELIARRNDLRRRDSELSSAVSIVLRLGSSAADLMIQTAVGLVERIPKVFALVGENVISPKHGQEALAQARMLSQEQVRDYDAQLARLLSDDGAKLTAIPALREAAKAVVTSIDPAAAERRRQYAEADRTVTYRPEDDGMASAYMLLVAEDMQECSARTNAIAETVCEHDPRTVCQRRADGHMMLIRGYVTLGCQCGVDGCSQREPRLAAEGEVDGVIVRYRTLINVVVNERTLADPENTEQGYLIDYGPITAQHARDLVARDDAVIRPFGQRIDDTDTETPTPATPARPAEPEVDAEVEADATIDLPRWGIDVPSDSHADVAEQVGSEGYGNVDSVAADSDSVAMSNEDDSAAAEDTEADAIPADTQSAAEKNDSPLVTATGTVGYRPNADLLRYLSLLYPRCVFPLCTRPARRCQIDHSTEYDHDNPEAGGRTEATNLQPLCVKHHGLKTAGIWIDARLPDGRIVWTGPDGERIVVDPAGTVLRLFPDLLRVKWRIPPSHPESSTETPREPKYLTRLEREHLRRQEIRQRNIQAMQPRPERAKPSGQVSEIEDRLLELIQIAWQRNKAEDAGKTPPRYRFPKVEDFQRPPEPPHPEDEPPPF